ncbi:acyl-CoA dehydrogenase family protein [Streptomyces sp. NPDC102270]|uniref:acyl-CoA dehydrogenase family protein n=1 Tax=Streptomyces sp. NPDC102270 TaxID=3366150 RepID=UPI0038170CC3
MPTMSSTTPDLTPDYEALVQHFDEFAAAEVAPRVQRMESSPHAVERDLALLMAEQGWFGATIPRQYGGMHAGHLAKTLMIQSVARASGAASAILQASQLPVSMIIHFGSDEQKAMLLPQISSGDTLLSIAVTEEETGSHVLGMETTARRDGSDWIIDGSKVHIGNSHIAHVHCVVARTASADTAGSRALTAFLVEHDRDGLTVEPHRPALGLHGFSFGKLTFDGVRIPETNVIGEVGDGKDIAYSSSILYGRPNLAAVSLGIHEAILECVVDFLEGRRRYNGTLADLPVLRDRVADMKSRLMASRELAHQAVHMLDHGQSCDGELINSKYLNHKWAVRSGQDAMELHGAHAVRTDYPLQRLWRDVQHTYSPAGTGEVQRQRLAETELGAPPVQWSERLAAKTSLFLATGKAA